ncbi:hypothetical protein Forpe1208_v016862 [Fusarium oxysporum f. sp. rapae]|uniref:Uncharacterized protein n=1 Tax=Fusarium oxysporum f. sp. rapae TaxID=485398 RepID=A0A8J5NFK0_FUSOX|nr:hypothetical protein Forpe1208_v016862 [Fusarium oxysporum f. sp. rapae]
MDTAKDLYSTQFFPRHNIQRAVLDVNKLRHTKLNDYTFPDLVFIATFGARSNISKYTPVLIQTARRNPKFSFFENWLKYCKALQGHDRYLAVYEGVIYFTAEAFPQDEAQSWHQQHQNYLSRLQRIPQATLESFSHQVETPEVALDPPQHLPPGDFPIPSEDRPAKRQRVEASESEDRLAQIQEVEAPGVQLRRFEPPNDQFYPVQLAARTNGQFHPMHLAARANLTMILSDLLQRGMQETEVWKSEREEPSTQTICLFWPNVVGDFVLDLIVSKECATGIAEARRGSRDALRMVMGDFLFQGMIDSDCFEKGVLADTVKVRSYEGSDAIARIILSHSQGWKASRVFPSAD